MVTLPESVAQQVFSSAAQVEALEAELAAGLQQQAGGRKRRREEEEADEAGSEDGEDDKVSH